MTMKALKEEKLKSLTTGFRENLNSQITNWLCLIFINGEGLDINLFTASAVCLALLEIGIFGYSLGIIPAILLAIGFFKPIRLVNICFIFDATFQSVGIFGGVSGENLELLIVRFFTGIKITRYSDLQGYYLGAAISIHGES